MITATATMSRAIVACVAFALFVQSGPGTLTVTAVPDQCAKATAMELWRKSAEPIPHTSDQPAESVSWGTPLLGAGAAIHVWFTRVEREPVRGDCRWSFADLPDGDYIARLVRPDGSGGSQEGNAVAGSLQTIDIPVPTVTLSGVVTLDGSPHDAQILISDQSRTRPSVAVTADANGRYTAVLDRPATYVITVRAPAVRGLAERVAQLLDGANQLDFSAAAPSAATGVGLASLTVPARALPNGCRLAPAVPRVPTSSPAAGGTVAVVAANQESFPRNPWIGFDRHVLINLLRTPPLPDGPPPTASEMRRIRSQSLLHVHEGYRAVYESADGTAVEVRAVRFDDADDMPATLGLPRQPDRAGDDEFSFGAIDVQVGTSVRTQCSQAIDGYLRTLARRPALAPIHRKAPGSRSDLFSVGASKTP